MKNNSNRPIVVADLERFRVDMQRGFADVVTQILENMVTKTEFEARMKQVVTKDEAKNFATKDDLQNFATKDDLQNFATKDDLKSLEEKVDKLQASMVTKADISEMVGELRTTREEQATTTHHYTKTNERVDDHEKRITTLELALV